ncbi:hypothetical protein BDQ17DRAFT_1434091 [Cyathus striatus]|nr:hypothetical protein BDQ17DRAFT_1434091 [Cyathus striatus]
MQVTKTSAMLSRPSLPAASTPSSAPPRKSLDGAWKPHQWQEALNVYVGSWRPHQCCNFRPPLLHLLCIITMTTPCCPFPSSLHLTSSTARRSSANTQASPLSPSSPPQGEA